MCFRCCATAENVVQVNGYTGQIADGFVHYWLEITRSGTDYERKYVLK